MVQVVPELEAQYPRYLTQRVVFPKLVFPPGFPARGIQVIETFHRLSRPRYESLNPDFLPLLHAALDLFTILGDSDLSDATDLQGVRERLYTALSSINGNLPPPLIPHSP